MFKEIELIGDISMHATASFDVMYKTEHVKHFNVLNVYFIFYFFFSFFFPLYITML